ncbi:hypothetical protein CVT25_000909 [Psilocybe cyanescens]|uniref:CNNM transmembrane domain-containing protein n=1 Tax=Psilocybe cyanescens TaxID=93625 RepID=A0A409WZB0_PSICY|nr:hypothetical protein CVT25_000909 [Psilocybe cyanescens]
MAVRRNGLALSVLLVRASIATPYLRPFSTSAATVGNGGTERGSREFWYHLAISVVLVLAGGVFAGLTLGLMGLDELHLRVLATSSENLREKRNAQKVLNLLRRGRHWVLVVLLLSNVIVNESLPIFLDNALGGGVAAIAISTTAIVIFGIIPQAISVRYGLFVGATCAPLVLVMMFIFAPIAYPIARLLDYVLGADQHQLYKKAELKSFLQFHRAGEEPLRDDELAILNGVLELNTKNVETIMTPLRDVVILSTDDILDQKAVEAMLQSGYSRFPVHEAGKPTSFVGLLLIKKLLTYDSKKALPVSSFPLSILPEAHPSINCFQALDYFQTGRAHLLLVSRTPGKAGGAIGVITLEDIIEEIISEEIIDETDQFQDNHTKDKARRSTTSNIMRGYSNLFFRSLKGPSLFVVAVVAHNLLHQSFTLSTMRLKIPTLVFLLRTASASPFFRTNIPGEDEPAEPGSSEFWTKVFISIGLVLAGGVFAGLTLGLMGLDELHLRVLSTSSEDLTEKRNAQKVLKLMQKGRHWVLVVLLLGNVIINESLPIFLDSALGGGLAAIVISTAAIGKSILVLCFPVFREIIPQAISVRYGLSVGAKCVPLVLAMMYIFAPIAWPIAKLLDYVLGVGEHHTYKKAELKSFLQFHRTGEEPLRDDEIAILNGVLELNTKNVETIMTPLKDTVILSADTILDHKAVDAILLSGYSRFPIHEPGNPLAFVGLLLIKKLLTYDPSKALPVSAFALGILPEAHPSINCFQALDYFQTGRAHLLLISRTPGVAGGAIGVITLEDVIEEIISEEIVDETDRYEDNQSKRRAKRATTSAVMRGIVERQRRATHDSERTPLLVDTSTNAPAEGEAGGNLYGSTRNGVISESPKDS